MAVVPSLEGHTDRYPLLMERSGHHNADGHVIDIRRGGDHNGSDESHNVNRPSMPPQTTVMPSSRNLSITRRGDNYGRRHRNPLNSGLWISVELAVNMSQIIAAVVVLSLSIHEDPQAPLFAWIIGYTAGCFATLPHLYWRYIHCNNHESEQDSSSPRLNAFVDHFKMGLDCSFAVWFVVGNVWVFGGHSSAADAPNLYRLCVVFLTFSCIGYAMPFILCAMICCCLPCTISIMGFREEMGLNRGATTESINALPTYKYKSKRSENGESPNEGGILAAGTDKERSVCAEDAVCCICLAKYVDNDELRELQCTHFFHKECVDKWLKINALCPLCKSEVGIASTGSDRGHNDPRVGTGSDLDRQV